MAPVREPDRSRNRDARLHAPRASIAKAARELGLSRQSLYRRMEKLGIATSGRTRGVRRVRQRTVTLTCSSSWASLMALALALADLPLVSRVIAIAAGDRSFTAH